MESARAEESHYDVTKSDKDFAEFFTAQMPMGSLNYAAHMVQDDLRRESSHVLVPG